MAKVFDFVSRAREKHGEQFDLSLSRYVGFTKPIEITCRDHGTLTTTPKSHLHTASGGCRKCREALVRKALRLTTEQFIQRVREVHGDRYDYSLVDYHDTRTKVTIICPEHGSFRMRPARHIEGRGCRRCAFERIGRERRMTFWEFVERVVEAHGADTYDYELKDFINAHSLIPIHCPKHGEFRQSVAAHLKGHGCPRCVQSKGEQRVRESLTALGVPFDEQVRFEECRDRRALPFDFFVPGRGLLIEYDGRQHVVNSETWGGDEKLEETRRHDAIKDAYARERGLALLRIPHWEYENVDRLLRERLAKVAA